MKILEKNAKIWERIDKKCRKQFKNQILENNSKTDFGK